MPFLTKTAPLTFTLILTTLFSVSCGSHEEKAAVGLSGARSINQNSLALVESRIDEVPRLRIFATSQRFNGNLGGLVGANAICQNAAVAAGLRRKVTTFKAILGERSANPPKDYLKIKAPVYLVDGTLVAPEGKFWNVDHSSPINKTEYGTVITANPQVWSAFHYTGVRIGTCTSGYWTATGAPAAEVFHNGQPDFTTRFENCWGGTVQNQMYQTAGFIGDATQLNYKWFYAEGPNGATARDSRELSRLYCIEQSIEQSRE